MEKIITAQMSMEKFIDIYEFLDTINDRARRNAINKRWALSNDFHSVSDASSHEHESKDKRKKFFDTENFEESVSLMENGWNEGVTLIENASETPKGKKGRKFITDVIGMCPCIPNAIMGLPDSMLDMTTEEGQAKQVRIVYGIEASSKVTAKQMATASRCLLDAVASIESKGIKVELDIAYIVKGYKQSGGRRIATMFPLKKADQKINLKLIAYPMVHPSFMRRQLFLWCETSPFDLNGFNCENYGAPVRDSIDSRRMLADAKLLTDCDVFINTYDIMDECTSAEDVLKFMSRQNKSFAKKAI